MPATGQKFYESYHGVFVNVIYSIHVECDRGMLKKMLQSDIEFVLEIPATAKAPENEPEPFDIGTSNYNLEHIVY